MGERKYSWTVPVLFTSPQVVITQEPVTLSSARSFFLGISSLWIGTFTLLPCIHVPAVCSPDFRSTAVLICLPLHNLHRLACPCKPDSRPSSLFKPLLDATVRRDSVNLGQDSTFLQRPPPWLDRIVLQICLLVRYVSFFNRTNSLEELMSLCLRCVLQCIARQIMGESTVSLSLLKISFHSWTSPITTWNIGFVIRRALLSCPCQVISLS